MSLRLRPASYKLACEFVAEHHRHNPPPQGHKFSIAVVDDGQVNDYGVSMIVGVIIVGRPVARHLDDGHTLEVTRSCTDGTPNVNSKLYGAAWRATKALGYRRLITYTQADEPGVSLRASGWRVVAERPARKGWDVPSRPRDDRAYTATPRTLWEAS